MSTSSGLNWMIGGAAAALLIPGLYIGAGMPFLVALAAGVTAGGGAVFLLAPRRPFDSLDASGVDGGKIELARDLLTGAGSMPARLDAAAKAIRSKPVADHVRHMAATARDVFSGVEKDPLRVDRVRRFLTYYLPRATDLVEAYPLLERSAVQDPTRLAAAADVIARLDKTFDGYSARANDTDTDRLDIELKLLRNSLDEDLGPPPAAAASQNKEKA